MIMRQANEEINMKKIGQKLREERERLNLSRSELSEIVGLSDYYVGQLERGERQMSLQVLIKIAASLHLSLDYLLFDKKNDHPTFPCESTEAYQTSQHQTISEIHDLLKKCSAQELALILKLLKTALPYLNSPERKRH
jgi:transcriptional regulator with XRE-family HTH domain